MLPFCDQRFTTYWIEVFFLIRIVQKWVEILTCNMIVDVWSEIFWVYFDNNGNIMLKFCEEGPNPYLSCTKNNVFFSAASCWKNKPLGAAQTKIGPSYFVRALTYVIYTTMPIIVFPSQYPSEIKQPFKEDHAHSERISSHCF